MSKSSGNQTAPQEVINQYGADILRLWVMSTDYTEDQRIGKDILKATADSYRRVRNTLRFLLGSLEGFSETERVDDKEMPELERWVLHRLWELDVTVRRDIEAFDFHSLFNQLHGFCAVDLSAFYFDIRKDSLYCDGPDSMKRRAARTVLDIVFDTLTAWLAPFISFTTEEAWMLRNPDSGSVHERLFPEIDPSWQNTALAEKWSLIRRARRTVTGALEVERAEKRIGSSLQAAPTVYADTETHAALRSLSDQDLADLFITSAIAFGEGNAPDTAFRLEDVSGVAVVPVVAEGDKCIRCWRILTDIGRNPDHPEICGRCADVVTPSSAAA